jgi:hypothetical protein
MPGTPPFRPGSDLVAIFNSHAILDAWLRISRLAQRIEWYCEGAAHMA